MVRDSPPAPEEERALAAALQAASRRWVGGSDSEFWLHMARAAASRPAAVVSTPHPLAELREQWRALATEPLHMLPPDALIASIRNLAGELLARTAEAPSAVAIDCPRAKSWMTPCVARDGSAACADDGNCVGCGQHPADLLTALVPRYLALLEAADA